STGRGFKIPSFISRPLGWGATMLAVVVAWVFFRSTDVDDAIRILQAMAGQGRGVSTVPEDVWLILGGFLFVVLAPNAIQIISHAEGTGEKKWYSWAPNLKWTGLTVMLLSISICIVVYMSNRASEFIYFQF